MTMHNGASTTTILTHPHGWTIAGDGPGTTDGYRQAVEGLAWYDRSDRDAARSARRLYLAYLGAQAELDDQYRTAVASALREQARHAGYTLTWIPDAECSLGGLHEDVIEIAEDRAAEQLDDLKSAARRCVQVEQYGPDDLTDWRVTYDSARVSV